MNRKSLALPKSKLLLCGAVLATGWLVAVAARTTDTPQLDVDGANGDITPASEIQQPAPPTRGRHLRSSLSMPYFSFAQALRPRS